MPIIHSQSQLAKPVVEKQNKSVMCSVINPNHSIGADGEDAKTALDVKARRGERSSKASHAVQKMSDSRLILALGWIKVAITPEPDGLGLTIEEAIARIGEGGVFGKAFSFYRGNFKNLLD